MTISRFFCFLKLFGDFHFIVLQNFDQDIGTLSEDTICLKPKDRTFSEGFDISAVFN